MKEEPLGLYKVCVVSFVYTKARSKEEAGTIVKEELGITQNVNAAELITDPDQACDVGLDYTPLGNYEEEPARASGRELIAHYNAHATS